MGTRIKKKARTRKKRHPYQANHSLRKWFKTRCEIGGMKPINVETLLSHSVGVSNSYYRPTETELLEEYLSVQDFLILDNEHKLQKQVLELEEKKKDNDYIIKAKLQEKDKQLTAMSEKYDSDIALLKDAIHDMQQLFRNTDRLTEIANNSSSDNSAPPAK